MGINLALEKECKSCDNKYDRWNGIPRERCQMCQGTGRVPTDFGREILTFVETYMVGHDENGEKVDITFKNDFWRKY